MTVLQSLAVAVASAVVILAIVLAYLTWRIRVNQRELGSLLGLDLLERLAPEAPINQDERGGCVWCGGTPPGDSYGYATGHPRDHRLDCPWIEARKLIAAYRRYLDRDAALREARR